MSKILSLKTMANIIPGPVEVAISGSESVGVVSAPSGLGHDHIAGWGSRPSGEIVLRTGGCPQFGRREGGWFVFEA